MKRTKVLMVLALALAMTAVCYSADQPQERGGPGRGLGSRNSLLGLLGREQVQKELKLTDEETAKVKEVVEKLRGEMREQFQALEQVENRDERRAKLTQFSDELDEKLRDQLRDVVSREKMMRLYQIRMQYRPAVDSLTSRFLAERLKLTDEQKRWIQPLNPLALAWSAMWFEFNRLVMRGVFRVRAVGIENLPARGPFVLAPNHASYLDPFAVAAALRPRVQRQTYWGGWTGVAFRNAFARFGSRLSQVVPIDPEHGVVSSLAFCAAVLKRGKNLVLFPEGERSAGGQLLPFRPGIGILLHRIPTPVVPVFIHGSYDVLPVGCALPRLKRITIVFGRPLDPRELERQGVGAEPHERITAALRARIETLGREPAEQSS